MIVHLRIEASQCRLWLLHFAKMIKKLPGFDLRLDVVEGKKPVSSSLPLLLMLEKMLLRRARADQCEPCSPESLLLAPATDIKPDIVIDLTGAPNAGTEGRILKPCYHGLSGEEALAALLLSGNTPEITIEEVKTGHILAQGSASLEAAVGISGAMEAVFSRVSMLLLRVLRGVEDKGEPVARTAIDLLSSRNVAKHILRSVGVNAARELYRLCCYPSHWRLGWRLIDGPGVMENGHLGGGEWNVLPHPVDHFYADPFVIKWRGKHYLFFEDLDQQTQKGVISVIPFGDNGPCGPAEVVLEEPWHLSYPFLLEHAGEIWMIPESSLNKEVALYRAVDFPHKWERHQTLLSGVEAADATLVEHGGIWWMFAVIREGFGGYSDALCLYKADHLFGPWVGHNRNPVLIDHRTARPAGNIVAKVGKLWRPVQDCAGGYGSALGLAEITRLDDAAFEQVIHKVIHPDAALWPGHKLHTLNRAGRLEVIDGCIYRPKLKAAATLVDRYYRPRPMQETPPTPLGRRLTRTK